MNRKSEEEMQHIIRTYGNLLYRNAYVLLGNPHDVQDVLQEVLLKYMEKTPVFQLNDTPFLVGRSSIIFCTLSNQYHYILFL